MSLRMLVVCVVVAFKRSVISGNISGNISSYEDYFLEETTPRKMQQPSAMEKPMVHTQSQNSLYSAFCSVLLKEGNLDSQSDLGRRDQRVVAGLF